MCWLKAIGGNSPRGYPDEALAYDLLPPVTRRVVARPLARLYPLLHHQNVALRTAFLDRHVKKNFPLSHLCAFAGGSCVVVDDGRDDASDDGDGTLDRALLGVVGPSYRQAAACNGCCGLPPQITCHDR